MFRFTDGGALFTLFILLESASAQNAEVPRWGQAVALVESTLFVHGGRTDTYNSFSYTSAPVTNDLFALSLSSSFNTSSPPWKTIAGCSNCSAPAVAWHTLTPFNTSNLLLFGGDPGPNSPVVLPSNTDSAALLDISSDTPTWSIEAQSWANEPMRRIYHTASSIGGRVFVVGGQKDDGSGMAFSDSYVFDPSEPSFSSLPSAHGPPDITGHQAIVLPNGRLLIFGGYSPSQKALIPLTTIWSLDTTQSNPAWTSVSISSAAAPPPRRGCAAALIDGGKILIQGGADAVLQTSFDDGWILDTSQNPMIWSSVSTLTQLGARRDHFALGVGNLVIFGFGYAQNGGASSTLHIFDASSGTFVTAYTPPSAIASPTTLPVPTSTDTASDWQGTGTSTADTGTPVYGSAEIPYPTGSQGNGHGGGNNSGNGAGGTDGGGHDDGHGEGMDPDPSGASGKHAVVIALSTVFGVLALLVGSAAAVWYIRHRRSSQDSFHHLPDHSGDDEEAGLQLVGAVPVASMREKNTPGSPGLRTITNRLSSFLPYGKVPSQPERIDMLAEEDTRQFDTDWYAFRRDTSSGNSSWMTQQSRPRPALDKVYNSLASLRSAGGAVLDYAAGAAVAGARSLKSREASTGSRTSTRQAEKAGLYDPYADDVGLVRYDPPPLNVSRARSGRQTSSKDYVDPFDDYEVDSSTYDPEIVYRDEPEGSQNIPSLSDPPPRPRLQIHTAARRASLDLTHLTPVSERPSIGTVTDPASTSDSSLVRDPASSSLTVSGPSSSQLSHEPPQSPKCPSSIFDANQPSPSQFMRRSNSWWTRFAKAPLLERRTSDRSPKTFEFRDPQPPPRLLPIEEASQSTSPESPRSKRRTDSSGGQYQVYSSNQHGRSASSLQTSRTANSEMLERMAQTMQIVQKDSTMSSHASGPSVESCDSSPERPRSIVTNAQSPSRGLSPSHGLSAEMIVQSPTAMTGEEASRDLAGITAGLEPPKRHSTDSDRRSSTGSVAAKIQAYERRMSQMLDSPIKSPPPVPNHSRRGTSVYGLAPKPSLFVANPDHKRGSDSS